MRSESRRDGGDQRLWMSLKSAEALAATLALIYTARTEPSAAPSPSDPTTIRRRRSTIHRRLEGNATLCGAPLSEDSLVRLGDTVLEGERRCLDCEIQHARRASGRRRRPDPSAALRASRVHRSLLSSPRRGV